MRKRLFTCLVASALLAGAQARGAERSEAADGSEISRRAVARVERWVGLRSLSKVSRAARDDCSGLTELAYQRPDLTLLPQQSVPGESAVAAIHRKAKRLGALRREPHPGDLVFFHDTWDRNRDGKVDDGLTHIGVVVDVDDEGTVTFVHRAGGGVKRSRLNLRFPRERKDAQGHVLNDWIRRADASFRHGGLAGELCAGFASVDERWIEPPKAPARLATRPRLARRAR